MSSSTVRLIAALACLAFVLVMPRPADAHFADADVTIKVMQGSELTNVLDPAATKCSPSVAAYTQELGTSGITRLRLWYQQYRQGASTWDWASLKWTGSALQGPFPDDYDSYYLSAELPRGLWNEEPRADLHVIARFTGERPSFWDADMQADWDVGTINCTGTAP